MNYGVCVHIMWLYVLYTEVIIALAFGFEDYWQQKNALDNTLIKRFSCAARQHRNFHEF